MRPCLIAAFLLAAQNASANTTSSNEFELHTAECVAALDLRADELAKQVRAGRTELQPSLLATLESGASFIGGAYLQGQRDEARSNALLDAARAAQKLLPDEELAARQSVCLQEGLHRLAEANLIGRLVVSQLAQRRMQKLLDK